MDPAFGQLVVEAGTSAGYPDSTSGLAACGPYTLTSKAEYDRGLGVITRSEGYGFRVSTATYDGFGRIVAIKEPHPDTLGAPSPVASALYEYDLPTDGIRPYSKIRTRIQDGASVAAESYRDTWSYVDGLGRTLVTLSEADTTAGDAAPWIASGITDYDLKGAASRSYSSSFYGDDPSAYPLETPPTTRFTSARYDAFGRVVESYDLSLAPDYAARPITLRNIYHAMSTEASDADDLEPNGEHENTPVIARVDGHGRRVSEIKRVRVGGQPQNYETNVSYLPTGEPEVIRRTGGPEVVRWMQYDSLGRMVRNVEPNTTKNFAGPSAAPPSTMKAWRYAYDLLGTLVGTSDPNGCGVNYHYLADGRLLGEDYSPCKHHHADYSTPNLTPDGAGAVNGDGLEVYFRYDASDPDASEVSGFEGTPIAAGSPLDVNAGQVSSISDRGSKTMFRRDGRGRTTGIARKMAKPGPPTSALADRYTSHWFVRTVEYDAADRATEESTGADVSALFGADGTSAVTTTYSKRGTVTSVGGSYGALVQSATRDAQGLPEQIVYGDAATTSTTFGYDARDRLSSVRTDRGPPAIWSSPPSSYTPAPDPTGPASVFQPVLENYAYVYDPVGNPITIQDLRDPGYWPAGAKPVTRHFHYDDLYRVASSEQVTPDSWVSPYAEENGDTSGTRTTPMPHVSFTGRMAAQSFQYDAVGNTTSTDDDEHGFYDRSLGTITNGTPSAGPYQLKQAAQASGTRSGALTAAYDDAGQLVGMALRRDGPCLPTGAACSQRFAYEWDEVGNLARARRWDLASPGIASDPLPAGLPAAELRHVYSGAERVLKTAVDTANNELHTVYVFESLELRRAQFVAGEYERTADTEAAYLFAHGVRLARLYYAEEDLPTLSSGHLHVLLELPDHLGSASFVIDKDTGELVEATRYQAYGSVESDYRPARWNAYRSDYRFTGKEEDIEVGLVYFGARYFAPQLNRWISPDPLALHHPGEADLNLYAYVHGRALVAVDPLGLDFDWGALGKAIMGGLELGAGVSAMSTCVTGVGCVVAAAMIYHGADTMVSGIGQLVTGQPVPMTTELAFEGVASVFTDDKATQKKAGVYGNIAFGLALSAMSIATSGAPRVSGGDAMKRAPATDAGRVASSADDAAAAAAAGTGKASGSFPSASQILAEREALDAAKAPTTWGAPGPAAADAAATGGAKAVAGETYEIVDGVRRAKAASELGHTTISAEIQVAEKTIETTQIPISALRSPTKSIIELNSPSRMQRWLDILDGTRKGDALPPIQVTPGSNGTSVPLIKFKF